MKRLSRDDAILVIRDARQRSIRVLGVDGFIESEIGYTAPLDLIVDLSGNPLMSIDEAAAVAERFVNSHEGDNISFDIVLDI